MQQVHDVLEIRVLARRAHECEVADAANAAQLRVTCEAAVGACRMLKENNASIVHSLKVREGLSMTAGDVGPNKF